MKRKRYVAIGAVAAIFLACAGPGPSGAPGPAGNASRAEYECKQLGTGVHAYPYNGDTSGKYFACRKGKYGKILKIISYNN